MAHNISSEAAQAILRGEVPTATYQNYKNNIIDPGNTLYWLDVFGTLESAIQVQGLSPTTPDYIAQTIIDSTEETKVPRTEITQMTCPGCGVGLHEILLQQSGHGEKYIYVSDNKRTYTHETEFIGDIAGPSEFWQADPNGDVILCGRCSHDGIEGHRRSGRGCKAKHSLKGFYAQRKALTQYKNVGNDGSVIVKECDVNRRVEKLRNDPSEKLSGEGYKWDSGDMMLSSNNNTSMDLVDFLRAYALDGTARLENYLQQHGWTLITRGDILAATHRNDLVLNIDSPFKEKEYGRSKDQKAIRNVMKEWGTASSPHESIDFPYFVDATSRLIVSDKNRDELLKAFINDVAEHKEKTNR